MLPVNLNYNESKEFMFKIKLKIYNLMEWIKTDPGIFLCLLKNVLASYHKRLFLINE